MTAWTRTKEVQLKKPSKLRIGVVTEMLSSGSSKAIENVELLLAAFTNTGVESIRTISIPAVHSALQAYYIISMVEASSCLARFGGPHFGSVPAIIPTDIRFADKTELARELGFAATVKQRLAMGAALSSGPAKLDIYGQAQLMRKALRENISCAFRDVDILVCPTAATGPPLLQHVLDPELSETDEWSSDVLTVPASLAGIPSLSIPVGPNNKTEDTIGVQMMAPFGQDEELLHYATLIADSLK